MLNPWIFGGGFGDPRVRTGVDRDKLTGVVGGGAKLSATALRYPASTASMPIIFRKTAKGVAEIETREHRLAPRVRNALILVDGKRDVVALKGLMPQQADESLAALLEQALIEVVGASVTDVGPQHALPNEAVKAMGRLPADVQAAASRTPQASTTPGPSFTTRQRMAVRALHDAIGPIGEPLAIRMERARNETELRPLVQMAVQVIGDARGRAAAQAYATRHGF